MNQILHATSARVRVLVSLAIALGVTIVILACSGTSAANTGNAVSDSGGTSTTTSKTAAAKHFTVGQQVNVGGTFLVTVNSVKTSKGGEFDQPKAGDTYLIIDTSIKNTSSKEQDLSSLLQFTLKDSTGQKYDETFISGATAPDGKLEPGDIVRGQLAYEVPTAQHAFTLAFEADIISSGQTIWDLKV